VLTSSFQQITGCAPSQLLQAGTRRFWLSRPIWRRARQPSDLWAV
jgi:hypothetical protein